MSRSDDTPSAPDADVDLVPRFKAQGYSTEDVAKRRAWLERKLEVSVPLVGACAIGTDAMRGNIENPIGAAQIPLGIAGPLRIDGTHARGTFYVPLATTEGALVRSYERGMVMLTRAGGVAARLFVDRNVVSPIFSFPSVEAAHDFATIVPAHFEALRAEADATTRHGHLEEIEVRPSGRSVIVNFYYQTGDAQGMNMIVKATECAARWLVARGLATRFSVFSGLSSEKRATGFLLAGGKGKTVVAGARIPADVLTSYMHVTPRQIVDVWRDSVIGHLEANAIGFNAQYANGLAALFIACGQDVANIVNAAIGITAYELMSNGDLYASVTLPSLTVATVGGGTGLGTAHECLTILGCAGAGYARKFAEIVAATLLAGELSMAAAIGSGEFVAAHETYGRNRPASEPAP
jgi:hydroxymethylglutaryl-CoA reductase (NADPH)